MTDNKEIGWKLDNSYLALPETFFSTVRLSPVCSPKLVAFNETLAEALGLSAEKLNSAEGAAIFAGNHQVAGGAYIAQAYAGHQFGHFTMLGDGRALLIGEQITPAGERYDIQLKGSGQTSYSRRGDGRAALGPMLREYIISEAMYALGIPTTRSLAVVQTGEMVARMEEEVGAVLARVASSHLRIGTFEYAYRFVGQEAIKMLADYSIDRHYPWIKDDEDRYLQLLQEVIKAQANLIAKWQSVGFIHGVMNTDNMTISGETIDYGPCAFMDRYDPDTVFSSIDTGGRYRYTNQPHMAQWNLCRLAETLLPLLDKSGDKAIEIAQEAVNGFPKVYKESWLTHMKPKLGIFNEEGDDQKLIEELLSLMKEYQEDYTNTFIKLTFEKNQDSDMFTSIAFKEWYHKYQQRVQRQPQSKELVVKCMKENNPAIIPRNHRVEEALEAATKGNYDVMNKLIAALSRPYEYSKEQEEYSQLPEASSCPYKTFCGT